VEYQSSKLIYRSFATLYFVFVVDQVLRYSLTSNQSESELAILDLIQVFVEALDRVFTNVCELDLIFKPDQVASILQEIITVSISSYRVPKGGMVLETKLSEIMAMNDVKTLAIGK
jgi:AP-3 complex subunit sigma